MCECCGNNNEKVSFKVEGMSCSHCVQNVTRSINGLKGIKTVNVNLEDGIVDVQYNPNDVKTEHIKNAIISAGYDVN